MSFLGQFTGDPLAPRLPAGHTLFLFTCERDLVCDFWNPVAKANACVLIPHDELGARPTPVPEEHLRAAGTVGERLGEQGRRLHRTVQLDDDAASIANFCLDGIGFVMTHAGDPGFYFMINR